VVDRRQKSVHWLCSLRYNARTRSCLARWALRLAKLDGVVRRNDFDHTFEEAGRTGGRTGGSSGRGAHRAPRSLRGDVVEPGLRRGVGSGQRADANLISGDLLVDFKTTKSTEVSGQTLDQLFGYFLLARRTGMPEIKRMGVYLSRYGVLRVGQTSHRTNRPDFNETEAWFFERARKEFRPQPKPVVRGPTRHG
jgi:hypothetical protein